MSENLQVAGEPTDALRIDLDEIDRQIREGLPLSRDRLLEARKNRIFLEGKNAAEVPARQSEDRLDYDLRPKHVSFMTRKVIRGLTSRTYRPGPARSLGDDVASRWLEGVYRDAGLNSLFHDADREATLQGVCAFQVACTGDPKRPIRIHLWSAEELEVWCPADDALTPQAVCTIVEEAGETVYTLYTRDFVRRYRASKSPFGTDRGAIEPGPDEPNPYGMLPFSWVHFERPTRKFWVQGLGALVRQINARVDEKMSEMDEAQRFYLKPIPLAFNTPPGWRPKIRPGSFIGVPYSPSTNGQPAAEPRMEFLQAQVDISGAWLDIANTIETGLSDLDVPLAAYRSEQSSTKSGAALVTEQMPLLEYARERRLHYGDAEADLARLVCRLGGDYYDWPAGLKSALLAEAEDPSLTLAWPDDLDCPTMDQAQAEAQDIDLGLTSRVKLIMKQRGFSRAQAVRELAEIVADEALYHQLVAQAGLPPDRGSPDDPQPESDGDETDPDVSTPTPGYDRDGDALLPTREDDVDNNINAPGSM